MKKKTIFMTLFTIFILMISINVTIAYLTDDEKETNVYTIGKVSISLDETAVDELGVPIENAKRVFNNQYHLMPGYTYIKDPIVTVNAGSSDSYVRILVTINSIKELNEIFDGNFSPKKLVNEWDDEKWLYIDTLDNKDNSNTYEFRYYKVVNGLDGENKVSRKLEPLFKSFSVPGDLTKEQLETLKDLKITIIGQAIQNAGFEDNADDAWKAFDVQFNR